MAVKINKEALLKHRFWVLVGITGILTLAGIFYLQLYGGQDVAAARTNFTKAIHDAKGPKGTSQAEVDAVGVAAEKARKAQTDVWLKSYKDQEPLFRWAPAMESEFQFTSGKFATEIKIHKAEDKSWPEDTDTLIYARLLDVQNTRAIVKARSKDK